MISDTHSSDNEQGQSTASLAAGSGAPRGEKPTISPAERWLLIRKDAYARAQRRGFIGGNPFEDWKRAEEEIDDRYATASGNLASLSDPAEVKEQITSLLRQYGIGHLSVDTLLEQHAQNMQKLAEFNRRVFDSASELANQQTTLAQDALGEAVKTLQALAQGKVSGDSITAQAKLSMKAVENAMSHIGNMAQAMAKMSPFEKKQGNKSSGS